MMNKINIEKHGEFKTQIMISVKRKSHESLEVNITTGIPS